MNAVVIEILFIGLLLVANGVFAMSQLAVISARKARLQRVALGGDRRARAALELAQEPDRFLSTVQIGVTLVGILAGAFGGATVAEQLGMVLNRFPALDPYGEALGLAVVVLIITYLSLVVGELVPKRVGLNNPEGNRQGHGEAHHGVARREPAYGRGRAADFGEPLLAASRVRPRARQRARIDDFKELFPVGRMPGEEDESYQTLAGFVITHLGRIPSAADRFEWGGLSFEVVDMDGRRVDKVLVTLTREGPEE